MIQEVLENSQLKEPHSMSVLSLIERYLYWFIQLNLLEKNGTSRRLKLYIKTSYGKHRLGLVVIKNQ